jgi:serine/threonine protein phosphatase 1
MIAARGGAVALTRWTGTLRAAMQARPGHWQLLGGLLHAAASDQLLFVHAGLDPARPITTQGDILWWGNCRALAGRPYEQYRRIVYGYDSEARRSADDQQLALFQSQAARPPADYALSLDGGAGIRAACFDAEGNVLHWLEEV